MVQTHMATSKAVIILPTYNERDNIGRMIDALQGQSLGSGHELHILIVDDSSPDGTADVVRMKQAAYPNVHLLLGQKAGLGAAYIRGMVHAMDQLHADVVFEMDADFSHKPEDVPRLMAAIDQGADFVIGSRYVKGGSIPKEWGLMRRLNSLGGNMVGRYIAGLYRIHDCTAGFRAIKTSLLRKVEFDELRVQGYAFQVALLHEAVSLGAKIEEVPVDFIDRTAGESKLGISDIIEFIVNAWWIRLHSSKTFIKFAVVGLSGVIVNLGIFTLLLQANVNKYIASPISIEVSIITNFLLNNYWTFRSRKSYDRAEDKRSEVQCRIARVPGCELHYFCNPVGALPGNCAGGSSAHWDSPGNAHQLFPELLLDVQACSRVQGLIRRL